MPCSEPAREPTVKAASAASAHFRAWSGAHLRIGHQGGTETLMIGDRLLGEGARGEPALAEPFRDLRHRQGKRIGHRYHTPIRPCRANDYACIRSCTPSIAREG
jgi:hypothetical protein